MPRPAATTASRSEARAYTRREARRGRSRGDVCAWSELRFGLRLRFGDADERAFRQRIRRIEDDRIVGGDAAQDLEIGAEIAAEGYRLQHDVTLRVDGRNAQAVAPREQRICRHLERRTARGRGKLEVHLGVGARQQLVLAV